MAKLSFTRAALFATCLAWAVPVFAQEAAAGRALSPASTELAEGKVVPSTTDAENPYEVALSEALSAHARGDYAAARIFMERAHQLEPSARTLRGLGIVAFAQGRHAEAIRYLDAALASNEKPLSPELRASVSELLSHAWGQVGRYEIVLDPPTGDFLLDGKEPDLYAPSTVVLSAGVHTVTARAPARAPFELHVDVKPGEVRTLQIVLAVPPAPERVERVLAPATGPVIHTEGVAKKPAFWTPRVRAATFVSGGVLVLTGAALWATAYARLDRLVTQCENRVDGTCTHDYAQNRFRAENIEGIGITSGIMLGVGAAALLTGGGIELWRAQQRRADRKALLRVGLAGLSVSGTF